MKLTANASAMKQKQNTQNGVLTGFVVLDSCVFWSCFTDTYFKKKNQKTLLDNIFQGHNSKVCSGPLAKDYSYERQPL